MPHVPPSPKVSRKGQVKEMPVSLSLPLPAPSLIAFTWNSHLSTCLCSPSQKAPFWARSPSPLIGSPASALIPSSPRRKSLLKTSHVSCFRLETILRPPVTGEWKPQSPPWLGTHFSCLCLCLFPLTLPLFLRDMAFRENIYAPRPLHKLFPGSLTILQQVQGVRCSGKPSLKPFYPLNLLLCASFLFEMQLFLICFYQSTVSKYMLKTNGAKQICNSKKKKKKVLLWPWSILYPRGNFTPLAISPCIYLCFVKYPIYFSITLIPSFARPYWLHIMVKRF